MSVQFGPLTLNNLMGFEESYNRMSIYLQGGELYYGKARQS